MVFLIPVKWQIGLILALCPGWGRQQYFSECPWVILVRNTHERSCHFKQINRCQLWDQSDHMADHCVSQSHTTLCLLTKFRWNRETFCGQTDVRMEILRQALLDRPSNNNDKLEQDCFSDITDLTATMHANKQSCRTVNDVAVLKPALIRNTVTNDFVYRPNNHNWGHVIISCQRESEMIR